MGSPDLKCSNDNCEVDSRGKCIFCGHYPALEGPDRTSNCQSDSEAVGYVTISDDERRWILGRPCFVLASTARRLRSLGHKIETSAEDEQAVVIDWMLWMYAKYGKSWRDKIEEELK
jgi:hypothetical protein